MKRKSKGSRKPRPDVHDCAKDRMHDAYAQKIVVTMPGGYIA